MKRGIFLFPLLFITVTSSQSVHALSVFHGWRLKVCESRSTAQKAQIAVRGVDSGNKTSLSWSADDTNDQDEVDIGGSFDEDSALSISVTAEAPSQSRLVFCASTPGEGMSNEADESEVVLTGDRTINIDRQALTQQCSCNEMARWSVTSWFPLEIESPIQQHIPGGLWPRHIGHSQDSSSIRLKIPKLPNTDKDPKARLARVLVCEPSDHCILRFYSPEQAVTIQRDEVLAGDRE